jgi:hypothetical protein
VRVSFALLTCMLSAVVLAGAGEQADPTRTVLDGVYTQAQAERGLKGVYRKLRPLSSRRSSREPGGDGPHGARFTETWREDSLFSLFDHMATRMPREPRTTLPTPVYVDIVAFTLQFKGYPVGNQELTADNLKGVTFVDKGGPQPLPNLAIVRVVGCLTPGEKGSLAPDECHRSGAGSRGPFDRNPRG